MINLRYHIVSLVAVFLALGLGVVAATTVADEAIVKVLRRQTETLREQRDEAVRERRSAQNEVELWERFGEPIVPEMMRGTLTDVPVVFLVEHGVDDALLELVEDAVLSAGGRVGGSLRFSDKWPLRDPDTRRELAGAVGSTEEDAGALLQEAAARFAQRLQVQGEPASDGDLLDVLSRAGFLTIDGVPRGSFPPQRAAFVVLASGSEAPSPPHASFTLPMLHTFAGNTPAALAEPLAAPASAADALRGERDLLPEIATVDHVDTLPGRLSLVVGLSDVINGRPAPHYGVGRRTSGVAPRP